MGETPGAGPTRGRDFSLSHPIGPMGPISPIRVVTQRAISPVRPFVPSPLSAH